MVTPTLVLVAGLIAAAILTHILWYASTELLRPEKTVLPIDVPTTGGVAIYLATFLIFPFLSFPLPSGFLFGATLLALIGVIDDFRAFLPLQKLGLQSAAVIIAVWQGLSVSHFSDPVLNGLVTTAWMIWMCNAFNVLDMMDGLAAGAGLISSVALGCLGFFHGSPEVMLISFALAGSLGGFLIYNIYPARIYMGDTGSLYCGFVLGSLAVEISNSVSIIQGALAPFVILGLPIFEAVFLCVVRRRKGLSVMRSSRDHVAQRLTQLGYSIPGAVGRMWFAGALLGIVGIVASITSGIALILSGSIIVVAILVGRHLAGIDMSCDEGNI